MNTSPADSDPEHLKANRAQPETRLPSFVLSKVSACPVEIIWDADKQTWPSKTEAELLADGQCEV